MAHDVGTPGSGSRPVTGQRLYLARHGRTALNARNVLRGLLDPDLDEAGTEEARRLGDALATSGAASVVSSPLRRALQTADAIAAPLGVAVRPDPRLADRDYGRWAGRTALEIESEWGSVDDAPGVEPRAQVLARALEALEEIRRAGRGPCAVVSHDAVNRAVLCALDPRLCLAGRVPQPTGCVNVLGWEDRSWSVLAVGLAADDLALSRQGSPGPR